MKSKTCEETFDTQYVVQRVKCLVETAKGSPVGSSERTRTWVGRLQKKPARMWLGHEVCDAKPTCMLLP